MSRSTIKWSQHGSFSIIPEWLLDSDISDRSIRLYAVLGRYADSTGQALPGRKVLADRMRCALSTLDQSLAELRNVGALSWSEGRRNDGGRASNEYVLHPTPYRPTGHPPTGPSVRAPTGPSVSQERDPVRTRVGETASPPRVAKIDGQNVAFDALCEVANVNPQNRRRASEAAGALREIRGYVWDDLDEDQRVLCLDSPESFERRLAATIRDRARRYADAMDGARLTPSALAKWWHDVVNARSRPGRVTADDFADMPDFGD